MNNIFWWNKCNCNLTNLTTSIYSRIIFKNRIDLPENILSKITWCGMKANYYGDSVRENCPDEVLKQFAKTAEIMDASEFNFFRGVTDRRTMIDLYDIQYVFLI